jgi:hypothetical protein
MCLLDKMLDKSELGRDRGANRVVAVVQSQQARCTGSRWRVERAIAVDGPADVWTFLPRAEKS